jgi:hypothetical protein
VTISAVLFYGLVRFRTPAEGSLVVLAAVTLDHLVARWRADEAHVPAGP